MPGIPWPPPDRSIERLDVLRQEIECDCAALAESNVHLAALHAVRVQAEHPLLQPPVSCPPDPSSASKRPSSSPQSSPSR